MRVIFVKATDLKVCKAVVGTILTLTKKVLREQLDRGNCIKYTGPYPPNIEHRKPETKKKIKLKDLK